MAEIIFTRESRAGIVTLNRPEALNAVTHSMITQLHEKLLQWQNDPQVERIIVTAAPSRAFCAGGDIRDLYQRGIDGQPHMQFFWDEYRLNAYIKSYPKPYISLIDGIVMGGGVGLTFHGSHRVAGDHISFAMPEVGIGFFPDVGGSYFLPRLPGQCGMYLALTGTRIKRDDCLWSGLLTHACRSDRLAELQQALCECRDIEPVLADFNLSAGDAPLADRSDDIDQVFSVATLQEILRKLDDMATDWAAATASTIRSKSPTSLQIAMRQLRQGRGLSMQQCMSLEYRIVSRVLSGKEFYEGIRAAIIDKDNNPRWQPGQISAVDPAAIEAIFAPLNGAAGSLKGELKF